MQRKLLPTLTLMTLAAIPLAACDATPTAQQAGASPAATATASAQPAPTASATAVAVSTEGRTEKVDNDLYEFEYSYPGKAAAIPDLKSLLDKKLATARAELEAGSKADQVEAKKSDYPYRQHSSSAEWKVVTDLPNWLSLSAEGYEYSGGAHGQTFYQSLLWDRRQNMARDPSDLFYSKAALGSVIRDAFCDALDKDRAKRRGQPVNRNSGDEFDKCIDPSENTIILGSTNGKTFDRIGILVGPYAAGSYAEGTYEITLPVTARVMGSVKPVYQADFSVRK